MDRYVCFKLNSQDYAVGLNAVLEVLSVPDITEVIHTPGYIAGVINLRGDIVAVLDLKVLFGLPQTVLQECSRIVVAHHSNKTAGILVDEISQILDVDNVSLESVPATITGKIAEIAAGVGKLENRPLVMIDIGKLFSSEELKQFA